MCTRACGGDGVDWCRGRGGGSGAVTALRWRLHSDHAHPHELLLLLQLRDVLGGGHGIAVAVRRSTERGQKGAPGAAAHHGAPRTIRHEPERIDFSLICCFGRRQRAAQRGPHNNNNNNNDKDDGDDDDDDDDNKDKNEKRGRRKAKIITTRIRAHRKDTRQRYHVYLDRRHKPAAISQPAAAAAAAAAAQAAALQRPSTCSIPQQRAHAVRSNAMPHLQRRTHAHARTWEPVGPALAARRGSAGWRRGSPPPPRRLCRKLPRPRHHHHHHHHLR